MKMNFGDNHVGVMRAPATGDSAVKNNNMAVQLWRPFTLRSQLGLGRTIYSEDNPLRPRRVSVLHSYFQCAIDEQMIQSMQPQQPTEIIARCKAVEMYSVPLRPGEMENIRKWLEQNRPRGIQEDNRWKKVKQRQQERIEKERKMHKERAEKDRIESEKQEMKIWEEWLVHEDEKQGKKSLALAKMWESDYWRKIPERDEVEQPLECAGQDENLYLKEDQVKWEKENFINELDEQELYQQKIEEKMELRQEDTPPSDGELLIIDKCEPLVQQSPPFSWVIEANAPQSVQRLSKMEEKKQKFLDQQMKRHEEQEEKKCNLSEGTPDPSDSEVGSSSADASLHNIQMPEEVVDVNVMETRTRKTRTATPRPSSRQTNAKKENKWRPPSPQGKFQKAATIAEISPRRLSRLTDTSSVVSRSYSVLPGCRDDSSPKASSPKIMVHQKSNRHLTSNAINYCCLANSINDEFKRTILEKLHQSDSKHFIILFRDSNKHYRSIYTFNSETEEVLRLSGKGPRELDNTMIAKYYKYNSGAKTFIEVELTKHLSVSIDAVTIKSMYWQRKSLQPESPKPRSPTMQIKESPKLVISRRSSVKEDFSRRESICLSTTSRRFLIKMTQKSNRHIIINALTDCCLAGAINNEIKSQIVDDLHNADAKHFIILFRDCNKHFRSVYTYNPDTDEVLPLAGKGPKVLNNKMIDRFYKYNCGTKTFSEIELTRHLSVSIDAVTIKYQYWQKTKGLLWEGKSQPVTPLPQRDEATSASDIDSSSRPHSSCLHETRSSRKVPRLIEKSNRHIITNAIIDCCLHGTINNVIRTKTLDDMQKTDLKHFIILFRDPNHHYRSVYTFNQENEDVLKISGKGPKCLKNKMVERCYKYNSGTKRFTEIELTKKLSGTIDAVIIKNQYWPKQSISYESSPMQQVNVMKGRNTGSKFVEPEQRRHSSYILLNTLSKRPDSWTKMNVFPNEHSLTNLITML